VRQQVRAAKSRRVAHWKFSAAAGKQQDVVLDFQISGFSNSNSSIRKFELENLNGLSEQTDVAFRRTNSGGCFVRRRP
jgi:hypothetical protein